MNIDLVLTIEDGTRWFSDSAVMTRALRGYVIEQ